MSRCGDWRWENMNIGEWECGDLEMGEFGD